MITIQSDRRAAAYMTGAHMGALALVGYFAMSFFNAPDFAVGFVVGITLVSIGALIWGSRTDEYLHALWNAGATAAFLFAVAAFLFWPVLARQPEIFSGHGSPDELAPLHLQGMLTIFAFYVGFHIQWLRSRI